MAKALSTDLERAIAIAQELKNRKLFNKIEEYDPYPFQQIFHDTGRHSSQRLLMCANRIGKSYSGAMEMSFHLTGLYPKLSLIHI